ncbi:hypothetical protein [Sphingomonas sp. KC8]|uniref:hypothetical protein n=1 Tax=Sphingomonas sp. KC8 TaxID=1030157 RepID=UPI00024897C7|nr:hypothetical protein [Sphingomonas sp. KC8]ARS29082.1 hypothetical protein KC8_17570 [Sphingomonas sp. KC8]
MATANEERGEVSVELGRKTYVMRPSFTAIQSIEKQTGLSLRQLAIAANSMSMDLATMGVVTGELIRAGAADGDVGAQLGEAERFSQLIYEKGVPTVAARLTIVLTAALTGGATVEGELKPVPTKPARGTGTGD